MKHRNILICFLFILVLKFVRAPPLEAAVSVDKSWTEFWVVRLFINLLGYASVVAPAYLIIRYLRKINYNETGSGICFSMIKACVFGSEVPETLSSLPINADKKMETKKRTFVLLVCAGGLQLAYLTWGIIQERIMTKEYGKTETNPGEKFTNSQFLVFVNRSLACIVAGTYILLFRQPRHNCPLYKFSYSSFSNIMSSWFQYEALKFVSFPTQVMGKACKVIPVMLMGKVVSGNTYQLYEWITAAMLSVGISLFLLAQGGDKGNHLDDMATTGVTLGSLSGLVLMLGYMAFDSFTSNWQGKLFKVHKMSSVQMMFGVNLFSCVFTSCSLLEQGGFFEAFYFMTQHVEFVFHSVVLSICSAVGQLFIFYTISEFGAVVFTIIMTMRQAFAILLSCLIYGHPVGLLGLVGILVVFSALFLRIYARSRISAKKPSTNTGKV